MVNKLILCSLAVIAAVLLWRVEPVAAPEPPAPVRERAPAPAPASVPAAPPLVVIIDDDESGVMQTLREAMPQDDVRIWREAIGQALPLLATDQDAQLLVGSMLISRGDPVDGIAWQLLACMHCTQVDERIGFGCAAEGTCDPNLELIDVMRRDFGDATVAQALERLREIESAIGSGEDLTRFVTVNPRRFSSQQGECRQMRMVTPECSAEEILRQTIE